jgi:translation initiation factor IF-3
MANPPVCKILDYPKYLYELKQRDKEARKKSIAISIKEMKYRPKIGGGDFDTKTRKVAEFLSEGHKVKITIMFRGREVAHPELGMKILNKVAEEIGAACKIEATPRLDGRNMTMVLAPEKKAQPATKPKVKGDDDPSSSTDSQPVETVAADVVGDSASEGPAA